MKVEEIDSERENGAVSTEKEVSRWNKYHVSYFQKTREKELVKLHQERPSKTNNPQGYFHYRAREEQIKYELEFSQYCIELLKGHFIEALVHYGHAWNHLKRRDEYEEKVYAVWLQRVKAQENPPAPDILFINQGIHSNQLI